MSAFGTMNLNAEPKALMYPNHLCNQYGFDMIGAGATISMAIECFEKALSARRTPTGSTCSGATRTASWRS